MVNENEEQEKIHLLEEKLVVDRSKKKVGEVVVRKEVETKIVEVPIRQEKLVIEQVNIGEETKKLGEIDLTEGEVSVSGNQVDTNDSSSSEYIVSGEFISPSVASDILSALQNGCTKVRIEVTVTNPEIQKAYQQIFDGCTKI
ncbi:MAG: DUF2382 domain-containing protein [Trichodesmium sp. MO_231.B1]|nr:DUF2382 domain-containing protein [Trichodesmium sp. MO_231.B1]